jgi:hypothetical protein
LRRLSKLTHLHLYGTAVIDAGLEYLNDLPNLPQVSLNGSDVTREGGPASSGRSILDRGFCSIRRDSLARVACGLDLAVIRFNNY